MRYWVDGYNVILSGRLGVGAPLHERRAELLSRLAATGCAAYVAFDARERVHGAEQSVPRRIEVAFARDGGNADLLLLEKLRHARDLSDVVLVSDDRDLLDRAPFFGVRTERVAAFLRKLKPVAQRAPPGTRALSKREVDDWMEWFGYEREEPTVEAAPPPAVPAAKPKPSAPSKSPKGAKKRGKR